ncbi:MULTISPECIES: tetratricopeptide repeat protein [unclassified Paracoccus (in: a-proteobacteria)]|uniref:tetratricopeptide repeat protein n=1 Tax=unclassified Paracoccus (in: a-proteobacteria) TaxID=2688777 RepID=UPI0021E11EB7|nr:MULTISPECIES: tetratricopeptide repeat protein [unclassified Paracoccus (in: a-proteobacteria)]UXU75469.1 tetratricopeptide repeat protein [Paracoccus sp. SMMA_5]UXU81374.1 tetratricopeptide repeat protein [Paracoccus sp. SMMA_5_TC]
MIPLALIALTAAPVLPTGLAGPAAAQTQAPAAAPDTTPADSARPAHRPEDSAAPADLRGLSGPYLAARMAAVENDYPAAANYYLQALAQDDTDPYLQDSALVALISAGEMERATALALTMADQGRATELARLLQRAELARAGRWDDLVAAIDAAPPGDTATDGMAGATLIDGMMRAWALLGAGKAGEALSAFKELAKLPGAGPMVNYHLALAQAKVGDYEGAELLLARPETGAHLMGLIARVQILSQLERNRDALKLLDDTPGHAEEPQLRALRERLSRGETLPFDAIRGPADGIAQVFLTFGSVLGGDDEMDPLALIHARLAAYLAPDMGEAHLLAAQLLQGVGQFDLAEREFERLRELGDMRPVAELTRIDALARAQRLDDAEKAALALTAAHPELAQGWIALGDLLRQQDKFQQAVPAYDKALSLIPESDAEARWFPLYARGIALERAGQFPRAEADFRAALKIRPDSAQVLNYLGYSLVDRNQNLEEALRLIQRAVELRPDDGYILDSLAWAYFRLGRYAEAVAPMERAVAAMAGDSLVNDHMGDIYWMVGRKREAQIQWQRALSLKPEKEEDARRIRAKLESGLDAVLEQEKANGGRLPPARSPDAPKAD